MSDKRRLVYSIVQFLNREINESDDHSEDAKESLEVASQCLQTAFTMSALEDTHLEVNDKLEDMFAKATQGQPLKKMAPPSAENKEKAEKMKCEGNDLMKTEKFAEAVQMYTKAIELDPSNPVFYCNRAAAHSKLQDSYPAIEDCKRAIDMDPNYGKAYGRMGLAYVNLMRHKEAADCFKKASELEPDNESYKSNLQLAQEKLNQGAPAGGMPGLPGAGGGQFPFDMNSLLGNPALMNMATNMLSNPEMQNMMGNLMAGGMGQGGDNMQGLIQAGQRLAEQMQQSNPDLVDQLRRQMGGPGNDQNQSDQGDQDKSS